MSNNRVLWWAATALSVAAIGLVTTNIILVTGNQKRQAAVNQRQQFINQTVQLSRLNQGLINALAQVYGRTGDQNIRDLLASNGVTVTVNPGSRQGAPTTPDNAVQPSRK